MTHGIDDGKPITGVRHVQFGEKHIELLGGNKSQRFDYGRSSYDFVALAFQAFLEDGTDVVVVVR
jgi:hypothetical protein